MSSFKTLRCKFSTTKMKFLHKYGTRDIEIARAKKELVLLLGVGLAVILFFAIMVVLSKMHPRLDEEALSEPSRTNAPSLKTLQSRVEQDAEIQTITDAFLQQQSSGTVSLSDLVNLQRAIDLQSEIIENRESEIASRTDLDRLDNLIELYDREMGASLAEQSRALEQSAKAQFEQNSPDAIAELSQAISLQEEINRQYARSPERNSYRLQQLKALQMEWSTRPLYEEIEDLRKQASGAIDRGDFGRASALIEGALQKQRQLNQEYRGSPYASLVRLREIEAQWEASKSGEELAQLNRLLANAEQAVAEQDMSTAMQSASEAEGLIAQLLVDSPRQARDLKSSLEKAVQLKDTAASLPAYKNWTNLRDSVEKRLRSNRFEGLQAAISSWYRATSEFLDSFPQSEFISTIDVPQVEFLYGLRTDLPALAETFKTNLQAVPGHPDHLLYKTEVPQFIYERVMGTNPSANPSPELPVDSLSWSEAKAFANRVAWILAQPVSLPSRTIWTAAAGATSSDNLNSQAWHSLNSNRSTKRIGSSSPNPDGFHDLFGNVSEWLDLETPADREAVTIGGSVRDTIARLAELPETSRSIDERNRFVGFRIVVRERSVQ